MRWPTFLLSLFSGVALGAIILVNIVSLQTSTKTENKKIVLGASEIKKPQFSNALSLNSPNLNSIVTTGRIIEIIDINTVRLLLNDGMSLVDLAGVRIPDDEELANYKKCYGTSVHETIQKSFLGKKVYVISDNQIKDEDGPSYVFLEDLSFLNQELIDNGLAVASSAYPYLYKDDFDKREIIARNNEAGIWVTACTVTPTLTSVVSKKPVTKTVATPTAVQNLYSRLLTPPPSVTPTPAPVLAETTRTTSKPASLNPEILFVLINNHRQSIGKPSFEKDDRLCSLAVSRGPELYDEIFVTHNVHAGLTARNLPYWITENMAHYSSEEQVFGWWMGSTIHRKAIESDNKYSCGECFGNSCAQLFSSFVPK